MQHPWEKAYQENKFSIQTLIPSIVVEQNKSLFKPGDKVLDIGCGNGRNAIYLAGLGCNVDAFDVADLGWMNSVPTELKDKITFQKGDINDSEWKTSYYNEVVLAREAHYLSPEQLASLMKNVSLSLTENGVLFMGYNSKGGVLDNNDIEVPKFQYTIEEMQAIVLEHFKDVKVSEGRSISAHTGNDVPIKGFNLVCLK